MKVNFLENLSNIICLLIMRNHVKIYKLSIFVCILACSFSSVADFRTCPEKKSAFFFANGMFTSYESAQDTLDAFIEQAPRHEVYFLSYNKNESLLIQAYEVISQKIGSEKHLESYYIDFFMSGKSTKYLRKFIANHLGFLFKRNLYEDEDLAEHLASYKSFLKKGYRIHIVSHSQGNFYSNLAYDKLVADLASKSDSIRLISIANPDRRVADRGPYFTFFEDYIVKLVPFALKGNYSKNNPKDSNHGILSSYYRKDELANVINSELSRIENETRNDSIFSKEEKENIQWFRDSIMRDCQRWFLSFVKVTPEQDSSTCTLQCMATSYIDFGYSHCPIRCDALCCTRDYLPWPYPIEFDSL